MVQVIDNPYGGSIFGRLGAGIGKGISEELPKVVRRERVAGALDRLKNEPGTPIEQLSGLIRGGVEPEEAASYLPHIQSAQRLQSLREGKFPGQPQPTPSQKGTVAGEQVPKGQPKAIRTPAEALEEKIKEAKAKQLQPPTPEDIRSFAGELVRSGNAFTEEEALQKAQNQLQGAYNTQQETIKKLRADLSQRAAHLLQSAGLGDYKDLTGNMTQQLVDRAEAEHILEGKPIAQIEKEIGDQIKELGRVSAKVKETAGKSLFTTKPKDKISAYKEQKKHFDKYGLGEEFIDMVAADEDITNLESASFLEPSKNKVLEDVIKNTWTRGKYAPQGFVPIDENAVQKIAESITPQDNILAMAYELRKNHLDVQQFADAVRDAFDRGDIELTPQQEIQLTKPLNNSMWGDMFFEAMR